VNGDDSAVVGTESVPEIQRVESASGIRFGVVLVGAGVGFLRRERSLWPLAVVPVLFAALLVGLAILVFWVRLEMIHEVWVSMLPTLTAAHWWSWVWVGPGLVVLWLVGWLGVALAFALALIVALLMANLLSAPFLDQLSIRVERIATAGESQQNTDGGNFLGETLRSFVAELKRLVFMMSVWASLGLIGFIIPGAHFVTAPILIALTILLLPLDYAGFALDRRSVAFRDRRRWLRENLSTMTGFGGVAFLACLVPGLNLLVLPGFVTAGTLLVLQKPPSDLDMD
jgi:CysZ protein